MQRARERKGVWSNWRRLPLKRCSDGSWKLRSLTLFGGGEHFGAHLHAHFLKCLLAVQVFLKRFELVWRQDVLSLPDKMLVQLVHFLDESVHIFFVEHG